MENLWFFANCENCQKYFKDVKVKYFSDNNACEKFFSCVNREKCNKKCQDNFTKERKEKMDKMFEEHPYNSFRNAVINEVKLYLNIVEVKEVIDSYNYNNCKFVLEMPYGFHYSITFEMLDNYYTLYDWTVQQAVNKLVSNIRQRFLDVTINKNGVSINFSKLGDISESCEY